MKAKINKIIKNTFIDGPGSRMAIFMQGCNLECLYCHNPETQRICNACGNCINVCPTNSIKKENNKIIWNSITCINCDLCIKKCENSSSAKIIEVELTDLYESIIGLEDFIDGVTISGGECTLQYDYIYELFRKIKANTKLTTFVDTNGYFNNNCLNKLTKTTDGFMFDLKCFNTKKHFELTSKYNEVIFENIKCVSNLGLLYEIRTVIVPGFTYCKEEIINIANYIKELNSYTKFKLIPFRPIGVSTYMKDLQGINEKSYEEFFKLAYKILGDRVIKINYFKP